MRLLQAVLMIFVLWSSGASAQALVRSGEHTTFSRLVVYIPDTQDWEFDETGAGYRLILTEWDAGFDTSTIFERMPQTRVNSVTSNRSELEIGLVCDCTVTTERIEGVGLIVDISDSSDEGIASFSQTPSSPQLSLPDRLGRSTAQSNLDLVELKDDDPVDPALNAFRKSLFEGLGRSASLELVDVENFSAKTRSRPPGQATNLSEVDENGRIRVTTAVEDATKSRGSNVLGSQNAQCVSPRGFAIHGWGTDDQFGSQFSLLRRDLLSEFDAVDDDKVLELARLYLYFGLGFEARALVKQFELSSSQSYVILGLSHILEPDFFSSDEIALDTRGCGPEATPWSVLGRREGTPVTKQEAVETISEFARWPRHLQEQLGSKLIAILAASNRNESVEIIKNTLSRENGTLPAAVKISDERFSISTSESLEELLEIALSGTDQAAPALSLYLARALEQHIPIGDDMIDLAGAFSEEMNNTETGDTLAGLIIEALVSSGRVDDAIAEYQRARSLGWVPDVDLGNRFVSHVLKSGDPNQIAQAAVFVEILSEDSKISRDKLEDLSKTLLTMGLNSLASRVYLTQVPSEDPNEMSAELAISSGSLDVAISILDKIDSQDARARKQDVLLRSGRVEEAWSSMDQNTSSDRVARLAWFAQEWDAVEPSGTKGKVAKKLSENVTADFETAPLSLAREFGEDSQSTRLLVQELLESSGLQ